MSQSPVALEVLATVWAVGLLALQLAPVGSSLLHPETIRRHLRRLGWHWRTPKHESPRIGHFLDLNLSNIPAWN